VRTLNCDRQSEGSSLAESALPCCSCLPAPVVSSPLPAAAAAALSLALSLSSGGVVCHLLSGRKLCAKLVAGRSFAGLKDLSWKCRLTFFFNHGSTVAPPDSSFYRQTNFCGCNTEEPVEQSGDAKPPKPDSIDFNPTKEEILTRQHSP
jgi:hypothetical protein